MYRKVTEVKMAARSWTLTLNNYTDEEYDALLKTPCKYMILGKEIGKEGTPHIQGYIEMSKLMKITGMKKINARAHWEARKGTAEANRKYCSKDNNFIEIGTISCQGKRNDLDAMREIALDGGMREVTRTANSQQIRVCEKFLTYNEECRDWKPKVIWIWGPTGTGKSHTARDMLDTEDLYTKNCGSKWWDRYDGHDNVIIDDFRDSWWSITEMLSLLDRYEKQVEFKGGWRQFKPHNIIITSCAKPEDCYINTGESIKQLIRRIDEVIEFNAPHQKEFI